MAKRTIEQQIADLQAKQSDQRDQMCFRALAEEIRGHVIKRERSLALASARKLVASLEGAEAPKAKP